MAVCGERLFPNIIKYKDHNETFQQSEKEDSFRLLLKISASMKVISGSQLFRITTRIQSGPDTCDKSRVVMTFLIIKKY